MIEWARQLMRDGQTWLRILYLFLAFPLGTLYFIVLFTLWSVGLSLAIVIIGFPILVLTLLCWLLFARVERELAIHLLGANVRPMSVPDPTPRSTWQRLLKTLADYLSQHKDRLYKLSLQFDNPEARMAHGFPLDAENKEVKEMFRRVMGGTPAATTAMGPAAQAGAGAHNKTVPAANEASSLIRGCS